jgi:hypothetical protein
MSFPSWRIHFRDEEEPREVKWPNSVVREAEWIRVEYRHGATPNGEPFTSHCIPVSRISLVEATTPA